MSHSESATPLGKVRGLGSAGHGGQHWLEERFTSVSLVFLTLWLVISLLMLPVLYAAAWLWRQAKQQAPREAQLLLLFLTLAFVYEFCARPW